MAGNQSRGLVQASKTRGWDPTVIPARDGRPAVDLSKIDVDPWPNNIAESTPNFPEQPGGYPEGWVAGAQPVPPPQDPPRTGTQDIFAPPLFANPDTTRETVSRGVGKELPVNGMTGKTTSEPAQNPTPNTPYTYPPVDFSVPNHNKAGMGRTTKADPFAGMGGQ